MCTEEVMTDASRIYSTDGTETNKHDFFQSRTPGVG